MADDDVAYHNFIQSGILTNLSASTVVPFVKTFQDKPKVFLQNNSSTAAFDMVSNVNVTSFTASCSISSTVTWVAVNSSV